MLYDPIFTVRQQKKDNNRSDQMKRKNKERKDFLGQMNRFSHQYARDGCSFKAWVGSAGNFFRSDLVASLLRKRKAQITVNSPFLY